MTDRSPTRHAAMCDALKAGLDRGAAVRLVVRGASMRPFLWDREVVRIVPLHNDLPRRGEIVLVRTQGGAALHRILRTDEARSEVETKGDGVRWADPPVPLTAIIGRADAVLRHGGWVSLTRPWRRLLGRFVSEFISPIQPLRTLARRLVRTPSL